MSSEAPAAYARLLVSPVTPADLAPELRDLVTRWIPLDDEDARMRASFTERFDSGAGPMDRDAGPDHATASAVVLDPSLTRALLVHHRKGGFWVQPGGHLEPGDASLRDAALREAVEETGVASPLLPGTYDLDHHALGARFGRCASHLDVGFAMIADPDAPLAVSDESEDVAWWDLAALPANMANGCEARLAKMRRRILAAAS